MAACPKLGACPFFKDQMENMPNIAGILKEKYCHGDYAACARYRVSEAKGKESVPHNLFPTDISEAEVLLKED
ncbi:hypothetical protein K8S19_06510 [bacterium]|nr:hypothetical protein [bacterium]